MGNPAVTWNGRKVSEENASVRSFLDDGMCRSDGNTYFVEYLQTEIGGNVMYTLNSDNWLKAVRNGCF